MGTTFEEKLAKYAELVVRQGVNIQQGQDLVISCQIELADVVHTIIRTAYAAGARNVYVDWNDPQVDLLRFLDAPDGAFEPEAYPTWKADDFARHAEQGAAFLHIHAPNPDLFRDANPDRVAAWRKAGAKASHPHQHFTMNGEVSWTIMSIPSQAWATRLFSDVPANEAVNRLWELIFETTRVNTDDPVAAWQQHADNLAERAAWLNDLRFETLHYTGPGTDLHIDLPKLHHWMFARFENTSGTLFIPNMPTEEVFTTPARGGVRGTVRSTKPLNYNGVMIEDFSLTFEDGQVVDFTAEKGFDALKNLLDTDEGAKHLGEVALVPHDSPISNSQVIFLNTLFDENASCHIALGACVPITVQGGTEMDEEALLKNDCNVSITHVDFMIGSADLDITGVTATGETVPIFRKGNWA